MSESDLRSRKEIDHRYVRIAPTLRIQIAPVKATSCPADVSARIMAMRAEHGIEIDDWEGSPVSGDLVEVAGKPLGAWVLKCNPKVYDLAAYKSSGETWVDDWTVADNYRSALMDEGQPVVLWMTGSSKTSPPGIWGVGWVTAPSEWSAWLSPEDLEGGFWVDEDKAMAARYFAHVDIDLFDDPIPRSIIANHPTLSRSEIFTAPQVSNPSVLTIEEFEAIQDIVGAWPDRPESPPPGRTVTVAAGGAGFGDPETNRVVEQRAMEAVADHYEALGYRTVDVSAQNCGWDLTMQRGRQRERHVEVKGVSGFKPQVLLTRNELETAKSDEQWELAIVTRALTRSLEVRMWDREAAIAAATVFVWQADLSNTPSTALSATQ